MTSTGGRHQRHHFIRGNLRLGAAFFVLLAGAVHLQQWYVHYHSRPFLGGFFLLYPVAAAAIAMGLVSRHHVAPAVAGIVLSAVALVALLLSRTTGFLGYEEAGWSVAPVVVALTEAATIAVLALWLAWRPERAQAEVRSTSRRAMTLRASVSSAPSKMDSTRASTK